MIELSEREIDRLKRWAEVTPDDLLRSIKETMDKARNAPETQQQFLALMEPLLEKMERQILEATKDEPRLVADAVMGFLRTKLNEYDQRLQRLEATIWRLEKR